MATLLALLWAPAAKLEAADLAAMDLLASPHRDEVSSLLTGSLHRPIVLVDPDPALLDALRWTAPDPARADCSAPNAKPLAHITWNKRIKPPPSATEAVPALIEQAGLELADLNLARALDALGAARALLPCSSAILSRQNVRALFLHEAAAHLYLKDGLHPQALLNLLAVAPDQPLEADYPPRMQKAFAEALEQHKTIAPVTVTVGDLKGAVYLDGLLLTDTRSIWPGTHVVQALTPEGEVRTWLASLAPDASSSAGVPGGASVPLSAWSGVPGLVQSRETLARAITGNRLTSRQEEILKQYLEQHGCHALVFAAPPPVGTGATLVVFHAEKGLSGIELADDQPCIKAPPPAPVVRIEEKSVAPTKAAGPRATHAELGIGASGQLIEGGEGAYAINGKGGGVSVWADFHIENLVFALRGSYLMLQSPGEGPVMPCRQGEDPQQSGCAAVAPTTSFAFGAGYPIQLSERLRLVPILDVGLQILPSTLSPVKDSTVPEVIRVFELGPEARVRLTYGGQTGAVRALIGLEIAGGLSYPLGPPVAYGVPISATAQLGMAF